MVLGETRTNPVERREHLLKVAREIFAERGYQATTMDEVATAAGFTKPILYQHFASKEALYDEIVHDMSTQLLAALADATAKAPGPREMVESAFQVFFEIVVNDTATFRLLFLQPHVGTHLSELRRVESRMTSFIEQLIPAERDATARRQLAAAVVGMAEGVATAWLVQQEAAGWPHVGADEVSELAARAATLTWSGLRSFSLN